MQEELILFCQSSVSFPVNCICTPVSPFLKKEPLQTLISLENLAQNHFPFGRISTFTLLEIAKKQNSLVCQEGIISETREQWYLLSREGNGACR